MFSILRKPIQRLARHFSSEASIGHFKTLSVTTPKPYVYNVELNRPETVNAINNDMWIELGECFDALNENSECRAIVISGSGKLFSAGIDFKILMDLAPEIDEAEDIARKAKIFAKQLKTCQYSFNSIELCNKPVISAVHSACIGAGFELTTATDIRYCTENAYFQIKEVDMGMAADVGTLQRLPKIIGSESLVRELCFTGRKMDSKEALNRGFVSNVFTDKDSMMSGAIALAEQIAAKSPVAVQGTKRALIYARDHSVQEGLDQIAQWNQFMLQSEDFINAAMGQATKSTDTTFSNL